MKEHVYPTPVQNIVATLIEICRRQKTKELVELLETANCHAEQIHHDNWNGGTTTWALRLEVPIPVFAAAHARLHELENTLFDQLRYLGRIHPHDPFGEVTISPTTSTPLPSVHDYRPSEVEMRRLWDSGCFRLFLSHVSAHRAAVSALKRELLYRGISAFVAHDDIEPSLEWQNEIALALRSMNALAALMTQDFHSSNWTDQELGWAFGRGVAVVPIRIDVDPYGFAGKLQAVRGSLERSEILADLITQALLRNHLTRREMREALVGAFAKSNSFAMARRLKDLVRQIDDFTDEEKQRLRQACTTNRQVFDSYGVVDAIYEAIGHREAELRRSEDDDEMRF